MPQALTKAITRHKFSHLATIASRHHDAMEHKAWLSYVRTGQVPEKLKAEVWASDPETLKACVDEDNIDLVLRHFGQDPQELTMKILRELKQDGVLLSYKDDDADGGDNDWDDTHFMRPSGDRGGIGSDAVASGASAAAAGDAASLAFDPNAMGAPAGTFSPTGSALASGQFAPGSSSSDDGTDLGNALDYLRSSAQSTSSENCAKAVRQALNAGGYDVQPVGGNGYAKDYGPKLVEAGFEPVAVWDRPSGVLDKTIDIPDPKTGYISGYIPRAGDVAVIQDYPGQRIPAGHMTMYDGDQWISDFPQRQMYPGKSYENYKPSYVIYRY